MLHRAIEWVIDRVASRAALGQVFIVDAFSRSANLFLWRERSKPQIGKAKNGEVASEDNIP
jgi:hypothetical protein